MKIAYSVTAYLYLAIVALSAGWDTNVWSSASTNANGLTQGIYHRYYLDASTNKVFIVDVMASNAYAACEERSEISGASPPNTNKFFRYSRSNLINIKNWINSNAGKFFITNTLTESTFVNISTNSVTNIWSHCSDHPTTSSGSSTTEQEDITFSSVAVSWSGDLIENELSLPTNYFTTTPWRSLSSTNENLGWHPIDDILNLLVFPNNLHSWSPPAATYRLVGKNLLDGDHFSWADAKASADINTTTSQTIHNPLKWSSGLVERYGSYCEYLAEHRNSFRSPRIIVNTTNYHAHVEFYCYIGVPNQELQGSLPFTIPNDSGWFDSQGSVFTNGAGLYNIASYTNINSSFTSLVVVGDATLTQPTWTAEPDGAAGSSDPLWGRFSRPHASMLGWEVYRWYGLPDYINSSNSITYYAN